MKQVHHSPGIFTNRFWLGLLSLFYCFLFISLPKNGFTGDVEHYFGSWAHRIFTHGISQAYIDTDANYAPGYLYILQVFGWMQGSVESIHRNIWYTKAITLLFDLGALYLLVHMLRKFRLPTHMVLFVLLNIAYLYNTYVWGQIDGIYTAILLGTFYAAVCQRPVLAAVLFIAALSVKLQAIVALPAIGLMLLPIFRLKPITLFYSVFAAALTQGLVFLPFIVHGTFGSMWAVYANSSSHFPVVQANAFNFWHLLRHIVPHFPVDIWGPDTQKLVGLEVKTLGFALFFASAAIMLWPLALRTYQKIKQKTSAFSLTDVQMAALAITGSVLCFFIFNTEMHERYSHPVILFSAVYAVLSGRWAINILLSIAYTLNLEQVLKWMKLPNYNTLMWDTWVVAVLYLAALFLTTRRLYILAKMESKANIALTAE